MMKHKINPSVVVETFRHSIYRTDQLKFNKSSQSCWANEKENDIIKLWGLI